jgi:hypothetical protein
VVGVHHDGVLDMVARDGADDVLALALRGELVRVHADDDERLAGERLLDLASTGQHVHAVDARIRPEVEHRRRCRGDRRATSAPS